jgi:hypothetical protein
LSFLLDVMRDHRAPTDLRIKVARAAAPFVHGKLTAPGNGARNAETLGKWDGFAIDIEEAKAFRELEVRLARLRPKRYAPSENGGPLTAAQIVEEAKIGSLISDRAAHFVCPADYDAGCGERL